jgi:hypothetical protein
MTFRARNRRDAVERQRRLGGTKITELAGFSAERSPLSLKRSRCGSRPYRREKFVVSELPAVPFRIRSRRRSPREPHPAFTLLARGHGHGVTTSSASISRRPSDLHRRATYQARFPAVQAVKAGPGGGRQ